MKKSKSILKSLVLLAIFGLFVITSCKKDTTTSNNNNNNNTNPTLPASTDVSTQASSDADNVSNELENVSSQVVNNIGVSSSTTKSINGKKKWRWYCANITTNDTITTPSGMKYRKIVIDFGNTDSTCTGFLNVPYNGQITICWHGGYYKADFWDSIKFNNFTIHKRMINGYHYVQNVKSSPTDYQWNVNISYTLKRPNGKIFTWTANRLRELTTDSINNGTKWDAVVYKISDQAGKYSTLTNTQNDSVYTFKIINTLIKHASCYYVESGTISEYVNNSSTARATVDFGSDGTCDNIATLTFKGKTYTIYL